ncbi:unnamed protein product [Closterium sp. NIES-65]|nr:unnamed protein product [Closterium sp. NIES-65]
MLSPVAHVSQPLLSPPLSSSPSPHFPPSSPTPFPSSSPPSLSVLLSLPPCFLSRPSPLSQNGERSAPTAGTVATAAGLAGGLISFVLCPTELVKCRLQADGPQGLFRGLAATALRESLGNIGFFVTYEAIKHRLLPALAPSSPSHSSPSSSSSSASSDLSRESVHGRLGQDMGPEHGVLGGREAEVAGGASEWRRVAAEAATAIASGGIAGIVFWSAVLPFDVIKTRIQTADASASPESLRMLSQCKAILRESGVRGFYAGLLPTLTRAFPANAAAVVAWELTSRLLGVSNP